MNTNKLIFSQVMDHLPLHTFRRCVSRYHGNRYVKKFRCYEQYLVMAFSQLTHRESLRDIEVCLRAHQNKLYHMGISSSSVSRTTLSKANERRDWRIYADFAQSLIRTARPLYANEDLGIDLVNTVYALDASTIDLCLWFSPGLCFVPPSRPLNFIPYWTCGETFLLSFTFPTASCTMSRSLTPFYRNPEPSTSWIEAIWTLPVSLT